MLRITILVLVWFAAAIGVRSQIPQTISFQGRVLAQGQPFTGQGMFKFALVDAGGNTHWRNDGAVANDEPAVAVSLSVNNGLFGVLLGDSSIPGMAAIPPQVFTTGAAQALRIWFNDQVNGFIQLTPDQPLSS